ncbi:MAG: 16S rRNA (cytosine(1402)-N(4))-methyltransferase RsmH [Christensenellales bacterium]|jgi:16S rRNA (cytosine1402-N4)-methyltransferase
MQGDYHLPVMPGEVLALLQGGAGKIFVDGTLGGGGHTALLLDTGARVIGVDRDADAIENGEAKFAGNLDFRSYRGNFLEIPEILDRLSIDAVDGILLDLGVSSHQLDEAERGFSYMLDGPLDMRMDNRQKKTAADVVNGYEQRELFRVIKEHGEENFAWEISKRIVREREKKPILTTAELESVIREAIPAPARRKGPHPSKRTFQALRIEVNDELSPLYDGILRMVRRLKVGGRMAVITFHSLEDRIVKNVFRDMQRDCVCPPRTPVCICEKQKLCKVLTRKPVLPSEEEIQANSRARSAKLRGIERV